MCQVGKRVRNVLEPQQERCNVAATTDIGFIPEKLSHIRGNSRHLVPLSSVSTISNVKIASRTPILLKHILEGIYLSSRRLGYRTVICQREA